MEFLKALSMIRNPFLDKFMLYVSYLGTPFFIIGIVAWYYLNVDKEDSFGMGLSFFFSCLTCQAVKVVARVPRPWNLDPNFVPVESAVPSATGYSFPSVHSQSVTSVLGSIFYKAARSLARVICVVLCLLVIFSRMYLGVHTPKDVLVGSLIGIVMTVIAWHFWNKVRKEKRYGDILAFFTLAFGVIVLILTVTLLANSTIDAANAKDSFETIGASFGFALALIIEPRYLQFSNGGSVRSKLIRFLIAVAGAGALLFGIKAIPGSGSIPMLVIRYALVLVYVMIIAPWIFLKLGLMERADVPFRTPEIGNE